MIARYVHNVDSISTLSVYLMNPIRSGRCISGASSVPVGMERAHTAAVLGMFSQLLGADLATIASCIIY